MSITFYEAPFSSATPVACALAELAVPHERVRFDLASGLQREPAFLALNPNGKVPTLVVDGTPMFEGLAILHWLGDRYGVQRGLWPAADSSERLTALSWTTWSYVTLRDAVSRRLFAESPALEPALHSLPHKALAERDLAHLLGILEQRLSERAYVLGARYSLVDLVLASALGWARRTGISLEPYAKMQGWLTLCQSRDSFRSVLTPAA